MTLCCIAQLRSFKTHGIVDWISEQNSAHFDSVCKTQNSDHQGSPESVVEIKCVLFAFLFHHGTTAASYWEMPQILLDLVGNCVGPLQMRPWSIWAVNYRILGIFGEYQGTKLWQTQMAIVFVQSLPSHGRCQGHVFSVPLASTSRFRTHIFMSHLSSLF